MRVLFIHGLESRANGSKTILLREQGFDVRAHDMHMGVTQIARENSVIRSALRLDEVQFVLGCLTLGAVFGARRSSWRTIASTAFFGAGWLLLRRENIVRDALRNSFEACVRIQEKAVALEQPDVVVGSSWGAAVAFELMRKGVWQGQTILLAPAVHRVWQRAGLGDPEEAALAMRTRQTKTIVFHDPNDQTVPFADGEKLSLAGQFDFRSVDAGGHRLMGLLHSGELSQALREIRADQGESR